MRQVVMLDDVRELELWPSKLFDKYLEITEKEVKRLLIDSDNLVDVPCPACRCNQRKKAFKKYGLDYMECTNCKTLYVSPRPTAEQIQKYFIESKAIKFWYSTIIKQTLKNRMMHQSKPRAMWIANLTEEYFQSPQVFASINPISQGFIEEIDHLNLFKTKILINPNIEIPKSFAEREDFKIINYDFYKESNEINANVVSALGNIDRVFDPENFLKAARSLLCDDGLLFLTASTISGFDLQVLWNNSKSIFPPDHINLLSIEGLTSLIEKSGFEIIELSTPGQLDVELVKNAMQKNKKIKVNRFISYMLNKREESAHYSFQKFLQQFKLSSHVRIAARKK